ncbi:MAG: hypothetical protein AB8B69_08670 [Chitinophagales bacterium]
MPKLTHPPPRPLQRGNKSVFPPLESLSRLFGRDLGGGKLTDLVIEGY